MPQAAGALNELLEAGARDRRTFSVTVTTDEGMGRIYVSMGETIHATYGHLTGDAAVWAMLNAEGVEVEVAREALRNSGPPPFPRAVALLPAASKPAASSARTPSTALAIRRPRSVPAGPRVSFAPWSVPSRATPVPSEPSRQHLKPFVMAVSVLGVAAVIGLGIGVAVHGLPGRTASTPAVNASAARAQPSEVRAQPETARNVGAPGPAAAAVPPVSSVSPGVPTVMLKLVIGTNGRPIAARVSDANLDPRQFEQAALAAAQKLEFRPALRAGVPVEAEVDWSVSFRPDAVAARPPESAPLELEFRPKSSFVDANTLAR